MQTTDPRLPEATEILKHELRLIKFPAIFGQAELTIISQHC